MWQCQTCGYRNAEGAERCGSCGASAPEGSMVAGARASWGQGGDASEVPSDGASGASGGGISPGPTESQAAQMPPGYAGQAVYVVPVPVPVQQELPAAAEQRRTELWQYALGCVFGALPTLVAWALLSAATGTPATPESPGRDPLVSSSVALEGSCEAFALVLCLMAILLCIKRVRFVGFGILTAIFLTPAAVGGVLGAIDALAKITGR